MAGTNSLGRLTLDLVVKAGAFTAGMTAAERQADKSLSAIEKRAYKFGQAIGTSIKAGAVLAAAALTSVSLAVGKAINDADAMRDLSIRTGVATEKLSEYAYAAKQTGTDIDALSRGLKILSKNATEALDSGSGKGKLFDALGVSVKDAQGNLKQLDVLLPEIADKFKGLEDGTLKSALALELMGKSGTDLIEFLNQGSQGLDDAGAKVGEFGTRVGSEFAAQADQFNDSLGDLKEIANGFAMQLAAELLPRMIELVEHFKDGAKQGAAFGTSISDIGTIADLFSGQIRKSDEVGESFRITVSGIGLAVDQAKAAFADLLNLNVSGFFANAAGAIKQNFRNLRASFGDYADFSDVSSSVSANFSDVSGRQLTSADYQKSATGADLTRFFGTGSGGGKSKSGKSDAEREAEKLKDAVDRLNASYSEQIALFGQTTEVAKLRYDLENTELSKLTEAEKESLLVKAEKLDSMRLEQELAKAANDLVEKESKAFADQSERTKEFIDDLKFEGELYGMNNIEREKAIALRYAGIDAMSEEGQEISKLIEQNEKLRESYEFAEDVKDGLSDMFVDFISGAKSAKDAFGDFADQLFKRALQFVADKAINAMFSAFSSMGSGGMPTGAVGDVAIGAGSFGGAAAANGSWWQSLLGAFGGGRAAGGNVNAGMFYRVNENGPEMLSVSGKDYLMMGNQSGVVTPNRGGAGGGVVQNNKFVFAAPTSQRTQDQVAQRSAFELSQAQRRNS